MDQNDDCSNDMSEKHSLSTDPSYAYGLYGPLENRSRVGDEYQTEIPSLITESEYLKYTDSPINEENMGTPSEFLIGLAIPIVWINQERSTDLKVIKSQRCLVPGCIVESWTDIERDSFLLGLYIFEKDFARLKRFIESKKMGDILAYYYGAFYRSGEYRRWSETRKTRGKRCILGQRIFSGLRLQELLCRLFVHVSQECQNSLLEVSRTFIDGKVSLEQFVISLKQTIGIKTLVDTVAIGKGKLDLTGNAIEPTKQNQAIHIRPEMPTGKACSSLTSTEILNFLTGDYRLSKARSNDLFWEAVWPRLLARGWHSEQPNDYNYALNGKHSLVFLTPQVKKFSRKLTKGDHYFDSITDVLTKVASDPQVLELENDENGAKTKLKQENDEEEDEDGFREKRRSHCYLQPRAPTRSSGLMKFTIVDTSLSGNIITLREVNPVKLTSTSFSDESQSELVSSDDTLLVEQETTSDSRNKKQKTCDTRKVMKARKSSEEKNNNKKNPGQHAKRRRRLTACSRDNDNSNNNSNKLSSNLSFSSRCSSVETVDEERVDLIDLNYPETTPEYGNGEFVTEREEQNGVLRRQSTRNRPPTVKALEALANGFLTINSRKKGKEVNNTRSRNLRYSRGEVGVVSECSTGDGDACSTVKGEDERGPSNDESEK